MGNQQESRFSDHQDWIVLCKKDFKETLQSKKSKQIIQRYTLQHIDAEEMKRQSYIYEWRNNKKTSTFTVEIQQMKYLLEEQGNCFSLCHRPGETNSKLVVYSEPIHKLYQNNTKYAFKDHQQIQLFSEILEAIDLLAQKFGFFMVSKQMVGFNQRKIGKVWINQNLASNYVQYKRQVEKKQKWQCSIIQTLIDICQLCTIETKNKYHKFSFVISQIRKNRLLTFDAFQNYYKKMRKQSEVLLYRSQEKVRLNSQQKSHKVVSNEYSNSKEGKVNSNGKQFITSTKDCRGNRIVSQKRYVMVPVVNIKKISPVTQQERLIIQSHFRNSDHLSNFRPNSMINNNRQNYVEVERHSYSYITVHNGEDYHVHSEINKPLDSIVQQGYIDVSSRMRDSSISSSPHEQILMVDSMIVVENQQENDQSFQKNTKIILDQSIILRGQQQQ